MLVCNIYGLYMLADRLSQFLLVLNNQSTFIGLVIGQFSFSLLFIGHHRGINFTGMDHNRPNYWTGPDCSGCA